MTPDSYAASAKPSGPQSWDRYAYVLGDPINSNDPSGQDLGDTIGDNLWESGGTPAGISWSPCGSVMTFVDGTEMPSPCDFVPVVAVASISTCHYTQGLSGETLYYCLQAASGVVKKDISTLTSRLAMDPSCANWLGQGLAPGSLMKAISKLTIGEASSITWLPNPGAAIDGTADDAPLFDVVVNYSYFLSAPQDDQIDILIHEMAHIFNVPGFGSEANSSSGTINQTLENQEEDAIRQHCDFTLYGTNISTGP
jgi:hypothetical protein